MEQALQIIIWGKNKTSWEEKKENGADSKMGNVRCQEKIKGKVQKQKGCSK